MSKIRKLFYILSWIPVTLLLIALIIAGLIIVPIALPFGSQKKFEEKGRYFPKLFFLYDNKEEGCPDWWFKYIERQVPNGAGEKFVQFMREKFPRFWWFAVRNNVNGFRYIFKDREAKFDGWQSKNMEAHDLIEAGVTEARRWAYSGAFAGYRKVTLESDNKYSEVWFGWKVGSDVEGMGFAMQRRKNRRIGS